MTTLLVVETSPRGAQSISRHMTRRFVDEWRAANAGGKVVERDLATTSLRFVDAPWLQAYFTPPADHTAAMKDELRLSDLLVEELLAADHVAIATPVYNYNVPAALKAWIDHVVRKGATLGFDGKGLLTGKRATLLMASGGVYAEGSPIRERDIATRYLQLILNVLGISSIEVVAGGGAKAVDLGEQTMDAFVNRLAPAIAQAARAVQA
jgi:FMN-dependent NADH-azoreductase